MAKYDRFVRYVKIDTQSDDTTHTTPSTQKQKNLGLLLVHELIELGLEDAHMDEFGNVYAHLKGKGSKIGLNAHMDTALEVTGANVKPHLIKNYLGGTIKLANGLEMSQKEFPVLANHVGHDLIVTDGNTLLGADDKAGIAIIMEVLKYYHDNPKEKHSTICVCFTVDEEIGEGPLHFDYQKMGAKYGYTIDGSNINEIECENFNAEQAVIDIKGVSIHPGEGKGKLINAAVVAADIIKHFSENETPYYSEGKQGFWHINNLCCSSETGSISLIIRDFKEKGMKSRVEMVKNAVKAVQEKYPTASISVKFKKQYENMKSYVERKPMAVRRAKAALKKNGIKPVMGAIRGGTDGATFSKNGLPTPNLGTASYNHHGRYEFLDIQEFEKMIDVVIDLVR